MRVKVEDMIVYQIYPKSFCDGNGDGFGDIEGMLSKIGYLKELGVNAVWITPWFKSPNVDNGYDVSDYCDIAEDIGNLAQAEELIRRFHENGIAVILDLVANHTSTQHEWFRRSRSSKDNPYREYYIWRKTPPNVWKSVFGGSAWEKDDATGEYYLHSFAVEQADLNWDNCKVRGEMQEVVDFWLSKGVDGFRCDMLDMISKDIEGGKNGDGPRLHEYIRELFGRKETDGIFTVGECWSANRENARLFCAKERKELTAVFAFQHLCLTENKFDVEKPPLKEVCRRISDWQLAMQEMEIPATLFLGNHDQPRPVSRFGDDKTLRYESATLLAALVLLHRGIPFIFQGEELGLTNSRHERIEEFDDVESLHYYRENLGKIPKKELLKKINFGGRDNGRRMMPWTAESGKTWLAPYSEQKEINAEKDMRSDKSVYAFYRKLIELRKNEPCFTKGEYALVALTDGYYAFQRTYKEESAIVVCGLAQPNDCPKFEGYEAILSNYPRVDETLSPYQLVVYQRKTAKD